MVREGLRRYLTGSVPISIALHLVALLLCLVIPLTARIVLPVVSVQLDDYVQVASVAPPPVEARRATAATRVKTPSPALTPTSAPANILPEVLAPPEAGIPDLIGTPGLPPDAGGIPNTGITTPAFTPPPQPPARQVRVADLPVAPTKTNDVRPVYPDAARMARLSGTVVMEAVLDPAGRVTQLRVIRSAPLFDQAAMDAVRQWRYTPSMYGGHPVSVLMTITIRFTLE